MDNIPEREPLGPELVTERFLDKEFTIFDPKYTRKAFNPERDKYPEFDSPITMLRLNEDISIFLAIFARDAQDMFSGQDEQHFLNKEHVLTPFDSHVSYHITSEDLNLESRLNKIRTLHKELQEKVDFSKAPLNLDVGDATELLDPKEYEFSEFSVQDLDLLRRLRMLLICPKGSFEARISQRSLESPQYYGIHFEEFYPVDSGPLPAIYKPEETYKYGVGFTGEGFLILLPSDPEKLAQIRAKFVMVDKQSTEN